jgi:predicted dehydrogenase
MGVVVRFLVIGLGSMGKRRIRNLQALGFRDVAGFDLRSDRCAEARNKLGIEVFGSHEQALESFKPSLYVISTSPEYHMKYAYDALQRGISCFIEASVVEAEKVIELHRLCQGTGVIMAPSCTMRYFPGPTKVREIIRSGAIGKVLNVNYQTGQYLPDWHPWEKIEDFYVSNPETGGCREIVPFELTWLNDLLGTPIPRACIKSKLTDMNAAIDDIYHCLLEYPGKVLANVTVEVISRPEATRELRVLGSEGAILYSAHDNAVRYARVLEPEWQVFDLGGGTFETGYINPEEPYIMEMKDFTDSVKQSNSSLFPNSLVKDYDVLQTLYQLEALSV